MSNAPSTRISYLDFLKGIAVIWVILMHIHYQYDKGCMPNFITLPYYMPIFFFISGMFFKSKPLSILIVNKFRTLIIPFVTFYLYTLVLYKSRDFFTLADTNSSTNQILDKVFGINAVYSYQVINGALWFFIGLFCIVIMYDIMRRWMNNCTLLVASLLLYCAGLFLWARPQYNIVPNLLPLSHILYFFIYFTLGSLYGKKLVNLVDRGWQKWFLLLAIIPVCCFNLFYDRCSWMHILPYMVSQAFCSVFFIAFSFLCARYLDKIKLLYPFRFYGENSLILFATHMPIFYLYYNAWFKASIYGKIGFFVIFLLFEYVLIVFLNRVCPVLIGKVSK